MSLSFSNILEKSKFFISNPSVDFGSKNLLNFSAKFLNFSDKIDEKKLAIYSNFDFFIFVKKLYFDFSFLSFTGFEKIIKKAKYLQEVNIKPVKNFPESKKIPELQFLLGKDLNFLSIGYDAILFNDYDIFSFISPSFIRVKNLEISFCAISPYANLLISSIVGNMGLLKTIYLTEIFTQHNTLKILPIKFGEKLEELKILFWSLNMLVDFTNSSKTLYKLAFSWKIKIVNDQNFVYDSVRYIAHSPEPSEIKNYKKWFPNLIWLEIDLEIFFQTIETKQNLLDEINKYFPEIIIVIKQSRISLPRSLIFHNPVLFDFNEHSEKYANILKTNECVFRKKFTIISSSELSINCTKTEIPKLELETPKENYQNSPIYLGINTDKQKIVVSQEEIQNLNIKISYLKLKDATINSFRLIPQFLKHLSLEMSSINSEKFTIGDNFPNLTYLKITDGRFCLNKNLEELYAVRCTIEFKKEKLFFENFYLWGTSLRDLFANVKREMIISGCSFSTPANLEISGSICFELNTGESVNFYQKNSIRDIDIDENSLVMNGYLEVKIPKFKIRQVNIEDNKGNLKIKILNKKLYIQDSALQNSRFYLLGDGIYGNFSIFYGKWLAREYVLERSSANINLYIKSENISGKIYMYSCQNKENIIPYLLKKADANGFGIENFTASDKYLAFRQNLTDYESKNFTIKTTKKLASSNHSEEFVSFSSILQVFQEIKNKTNNYDFPILITN